MSVLKKSKLALILIAGLMMAGFAFAQTESPKDIAGIATNVTSTISAVGNLMVAIAYLAGFGFLMFGVLKFKQHKDNPTQVTLGTPIVMTLIGAVLVFIGGFIAPLGKTFGMDKESNKIEIPGAKP